MTPRGPLPAARAYHSFTASGGLCVSLFGRSTNSSLVTAKHSIAVYDPSSNRWIDPTCVEGAVPIARSSHRASAVAGGVLVFGGAPGRRDKSQRLDDLQFLSLSKDAKHAAWQQCTMVGSKGTAVKGPAAACVVESLLPEGRAAHAQAVIGGKLYILAGYSNHKSYASDAWCCSFDETPLPKHAEPQPPAPSAGVPRGSKTAPLAAEPGQAGPLSDANWKSARRSGAPAGEAAPDVKRQRVSPPGKGTGPGTGTAATAGVGMAVAQAELQGQLRVLREALDQQRAREAGLLQDKGGLQAQMDRLKAEVRLHRCWCCEGMGAPRFPRLP